MLMTSVLFSAEYDNPNESKFILEVRLIIMWTCMYIYLIISINYSWLCILYVGPYIKLKKWFECHIIYANYLEMTRSQFNWLRRRVHECVLYISLYVCWMIKSNMIVGKNKMVSKYSKSCLMVLGIFY
jgi:hypothetical protein